MAETWLDKLDWTSGEWETPDGNKVPCRKANIGDYYDMGTTITFVGEYSSSVILTEWPRTYSLDVIIEGADGNGFELADVIEFKFVTNIFKIPRSAILTKGKDWWLEQRQKVKRALGEGDLSGDERGWREFRPPNDDVEYDPYGAPIIKTPLGAAYQPNSLWAIREPSELRQFYARSYADDWDEFEMGEF